MRLMQQNGTSEARPDDPRLFIDDTAEKNNNNSSTSSDKENDGVSASNAIVTYEEDKVCFETGAYVLARWYDELFYPAVLLKVDAEEDICHVQFDDGSKVTVPAIHVQWPPLTYDREIRCSLCHQLPSKPPNQIVICDDCGLGFHQRCHHPLISEGTLKADTDWFCVLCSVKKQPQKNGLQVAKFSGQICTSLQKRILPYQLSTLHWTENHCQNQEKTYCYCGGPGQWFLKMVQCTRCKQWFHEACLTVKPSLPQTCGDTLYLFLCCNCNYGSELLHRIDLRWADIAHIALFNLSLGRSKYADFDMDLMPWINDRWDRLHVGKLESVAVGERFMLVLRALRDDTVKFKNGSEIRKRAAWYALRVRSPPFVPAVSLPPATPHGIVPGMLTEWLESGTNRVLHLPPSSVPISVPNLFSKNGTGVKKRKRCPDSDGDDVEQPPKSKRKRLMITDEIFTDDIDVVHPKTKGRYKKDKSVQSSTCSSPLPDDEEPKLKRKAKRKFCSVLDRMIPELSDYSGVNNPFLYEMEREALTAKQKARSQIFNTFTSGLPEVKTKTLKDSDSTTSSVASSSEIGSEYRNGIGNGHVNGLRRRGSLNGFANEASANSLERCIYEGDILEWDEFQIRAVRTDKKSGNVQMFTEYYSDMPELKMKL